MNLPLNVIKIIKKLNENGFEAYIVGGCVRDMLMGAEPKDWDITTSAKPDETKKIFSHTVDTGIQHGTVTIVMDKENYEATTYRIDGQYKDSRRPEEVFFTSNLEEDLLRRDFTINAIAYHFETGFVDPFGGKTDIDKKIIKGVGNPDARFKEDALRMLRAIRFSCKLGFKIENATFDALKENAHLIKNISAERIRDEVIKTFTSHNIANCKYFLSCNLLDYALPYFSEFLKKDFEDFIEYLEKIPPKKRDSVNALALFFRNIEEKNLKISIEYLKLDKNSSKSISTIVNLLHENFEENIYAIKKIISQTGEDIFFRTLIIKSALGENTNVLNQIGQEIIHNRYPLFIKDLDINGNELMENFPIKGKEVGEVLAFLQEKVLSEPLNNNKIRLIELSKQYLDNRN